MIGMLRTMRSPGVSIGTMTIEWRRCFGVENPSSEIPITISILQFGCAAPVVNHLRPLITYSLPSRRILVWMLVASDEATSGSDIAKHERISPSSKGRSHCAYCSGVAHSFSNSILPVSGALQLNISEAHGMRPMISASGA